MMNLKPKYRWARKKGDKKDQWLHSDFRDVAMNYVWKMYERMVMLTELENE